MTTYKRSSQKIMEEKLTEYWLKIVVIINYIELVKHAPDNCMCSKSRAWKSLVPHCDQ